MKTLIYCFKNDIEMKVCDSQLKYFNEFNWNNFNLGDPIYVNDELFGTFYSRNSDLNNVVIKI